MPSPPLTLIIISRTHFQYIFSIFMYFLQNKKTVSSTNEIDEQPIHLTERLSLKRTIPKLSCNLDESEIGEKQNNQDKKTFFGKYRLNENHKLGIANNNFGFLTKNTELMNRTLNNVTLRSQSNAFRLKIPIFQTIKRKQFKLDKIRKQEWIAVHKKIATNFAKFSDNQERRIYRSRKKGLEKSIQVFVARQEKCQCFQGIFPMSRLNSVMISLPDKVNSKQKLLLIGGLSSQMNIKLHLHEYIPTDHLWQKFDDQLPSSPQFNLSQHLVLTYQKSIFIIGGIAVIPSHTQHKNQRYNIPFISSFNFKTSKWSRTNWNIYLRTHAGASFGNYGIIDGGICEEDRNSSKIYVFDMSKSQPPVSVSNRGLGLSHHKIVSTQTFEDKSRSFLRYDGLFCFGGKRQDGELNDKMYLMSYDYRCSDLSQKFGRFQWNELQIWGPSPKARYMHSMDLLETKSNIFERKAYCAVLGGIGQNESVLNDFWLLDLNSLQWCEVTINQDLILQNGLAGHCTVATKNKIFVFGGYNCQREYISKFWTINVQNSFQATKKQYKMINKQQQ